MGKKTKSKNDVTGVAKFIHPYKKENKQKNLRENVNKLHTHTYNITSKNYRDTAVLIGICVDVLPKFNQITFKCHPLKIISKKQRKSIYFFGDILKNHEKILVSSFIII